MGNKWKGNKYHSVIMEDETSWQEQMMALGFYVSSQFWEGWLLLLGNEKSQKQLSHSLSGARFCSMAPDWRTEENLKLQYLGFSMYRSGLKIMD